MATISWVSKRALVAAISLVVASACTGSTTSSSAVSDPSSVPATSEPPPSLTDVLSGGPYTFGPFEDVTVVATGPEGWTGYPDWAMDGPEPLRADAPNGIGVAFFSPNGVYSDPCHWDWNGTGQADTGDVKVGPKVDDLVAALRANTYYTSSTPKPVTIDGYQGQELELQLPDGPQTHCDKDDPNDPGGHEFVFSGAGLYAQGPANRWHVYALDVDGTRLVAVVLSYAKTPQKDVDLAENSVDTMQIST